MSITSVRLSITIARLAADAPIVAQLAVDLHRRLATSHDVDVTLDANSIKCAKLSVSIRNLHATAEEIGQIANSTRTYTVALMRDFEFNPSKVSIRRDPGIRVVVERMEQDPSVWVRAWRTLTRSTPETRT